MATREVPAFQNNISDVVLCAFALADCVVHIELQSAKYLRAVHRTALELAVPNLFGTEIGGFWLRPDQVDQLRKLPDCYAQMLRRLLRLWQHKPKNLASRSEEHCELKQLEIY